MITGYQERGERDEKTIKGLNEEVVVLNNQARLAEDKQLSLDQKVGALETQLVSGALPACARVTTVTHCTRSLC